MEHVLHLQLLPLWSGGNAAADATKEQETLRNIVALAQRMPIIFAGVSETSTTIQTSWD